AIEELFIDQHFNLVEEIKKKKEKPYIIAFIGVNGSGKTTTMAKIAHMLIQHRLSVVFAASDTFRAAAIQQLEEHAKKLGVKMIKHEYESDPAAVAYDAVQHARARNIDVVLIDTAGRLHSNDNLMNELKKLVRVNKPDLKIFVGESITGNDCIEQAKLFNQAVGIDVIILAKADVDEKGGAAVSISYVTKKPIIYLGTGQKYEDLAEFKPELVMKSIGL
ncbi:MAG TPA: signal recognition particle-docking protein FtsY, partial [Candidatus Woesearchaeota archaeon]|nr:signal recognition particle-docking protein FtsY [Candidatus Woesearchaeota archaeon]